MGRTFLFSPVGNTDPIKYFRDGSMLHICRVYKPDVVYLYLTYEMMQNHKKDNRYVTTLELLGDSMDHKFEINLIEREEMVEVHRYDMFYQEFHKIIGEIEGKMQPKDRLLLNMTSGTPSMKSALLVMATLAEYRFQPIQVSSPQGMSNKGGGEEQEYDIQYNWELDNDNDPHYENRCEEVACMNLMRLLKIDILKKHLLAYDYHAALEIGRELNKRITPEAIAYIEAAEARINLDWKTLMKTGCSKKKEFVPVMEGDKRKIFEYALALDVKIRRGEYADFLRGITPLIYDLFERILGQLCNINISDYSAVKKGIRKWNAKKLEGTEIQEILNDYYPFQFDNRGIIKSDHLNAIIQKKCINKALAMKADDLRRIEGSIRNIAAHEIVSVTDMWIKEKTGKSSEEIMNSIHYICGQVKINTKQENWNSYDEMNEFIVKELENSF